MSTVRLQVVFGYVPLLAAVIIGLYLSTAAIADPDEPFDPEVLRNWEEARQLAESEAYFPAAALYSEAARIEPRIVTCMLPVVFAYRAGLMRLYDMETHSDAYAAGPVPRTLDEIEMALVDNSRDPQALRERGLLYAAVGDWKQAQKDFELALTSDPEPWQVQVLLARIWLGWRDILTQMNYAAALGNQPRPDPPEWWLDALASRPQELIDAAIAGGARGPYVDATLGEVLRDENLGEGDADVAVQIAAAFERAFQALPSGLPRNRLLVEMTADIEMDLTLALIATGEMDRATELIVQTVDTSAADALCGER